MANLNGFLQTETVKRIENRFEKRSAQSKADIEEKRLKILKRIQRANLALESLDNGNQDSFITRLITAFLMEASGSISAIVTELEKIANRSPFQNLVLSAGKRILSAK